MLGLGLGFFRDKQLIVRLLAVSILLVGLHSIALGAFIFLFTDKFYAFFFHTRLDNLFFIKQAGLFLMCLGSFYLLPLFDIEQSRRPINMIILTKILAVLYLLTHADIVPWPPIIFLAAAGDGAMALLLIVVNRKVQADA